MCIDKQPSAKGRTLKAKRPKVKTYEHRGIKIRELRPELPEGGGGYFQVDLMRRGSRERSGFDTLERAKTYCRQIGGKIEDEGAAVLAMSPVERHDAVQAQEELRGKATLLDAARFWMKHNGGEDGVTVEEAGRRWLAELRRQGCRPTTIRARTFMVESIARAMGKKPVAAVTRGDLEKWMEGKTGQTWDTYRRTVRALLQYATEEKLVDYNVAAALRPVRADEKLPVPFTVAAVADILRAAEKYAPEVVPVLAVQFFCGLRPTEALGLRWEHVDFKSKTVRVLPETSKVRRTRIVFPISAAALAWLAPYRKTRGPIGITTPSQQSYFMHRKPCGPEYVQEGIPIAERKPDTRPKGLLAAAGVDWIQDGPRKTFASAHYAMHSDAAKLAAILGHTGGHDVLFRHYRGLITKAEGRRFFAIRPKTETKSGMIKANFKKAAS